MKINWFCEHCHDTSGDEASNLHLLKEQAECKSCGKIASYCGGSYTSLVASAYGDMDGHDEEHDQPIREPRWIWESDERES